MKRTRWWTLLLAVVLAAGCGKPKPTLTTQISTNAATADGAGADAAPQPPIHGADLQAAAAQAPVVIPESADTSATLSRLSLELRRYVARTRSAPNTFEDFVAKAQVQAPPAPAGKKYALKSGAIVLVNQ